MLFAELAGAVHTSVVLRFVERWVDLVVDSFRGQQDRTIRRAAASLAEGVLRRGMEEWEKGEAGIVEGIRGREDRLVAALRVGEEGGWGGGTCKGLGDGGEGRDEGVRVRCKDAVKAWEEIERVGGWSGRGGGGRKEEEWVGAVKGMMAGRKGEGERGKMEINMETLGLKEVMKDVK